MNTLVWSGVRRRGTALALAAILGTPAAAWAQSTQVPADVVQFDVDPDTQLVVAEPDFTLAALPTTLRMPKGKFVFRMTHRFSRPIGQGDAGDFFSDFFGFDSPALIAFELRYGLAPGTQVTVSRQNNKRIQFYGQTQLLGRTADRGTALDVLYAVDGGDNFTESFAPSVGMILSQAFGERGAIYVEPVVVFNADEGVGLQAEDDQTVMLGVGARLRLGASRTYVVGEYAPRLSGFERLDDHISVAIERRMGGHVFQFNVSNTLATTLAHMARGGFGTDQWYIGFNLTRKFF